MLKYFLFIITFSLLSCSIPVDFSGSKFASETSNPLPSPAQKVEQRSLYKSSNRLLDIVLIVDNSNSMATEHRKIIEDFGPQFTPHIQGLRWRLGLLTTDARTQYGFFSKKPTPSGFGGKFAFVNGNRDRFFDAQTEYFYELFKNIVQRRQEAQCDSDAADDSLDEVEEINYPPREDQLCGSGKEKPLTTFIQSIDLRDTTNQDFFRDRAHLAVLFLSDENEDSSVVAKDVINKVRQVWGEKKIFKAYTISVLEGDTRCRNLSGRASRYGIQMLALSRATEGLSRSICERSYGKIFKDISRHIYESFLIKIPLTHKPVLSSLKVTLNPEPVQGFEYVVKNQLIIFNQPLDRDTEFVITYNVDKD